MEIFINNTQNRHSIEGLAETIINGFQCLRQLEDLDDIWEVTVTFVDDQAIQKLNRDYRQLDEPTDVLSFPQIEEDDPFPLLEVDRSLGDIVISLERAASQARESGHSLRQEVLFLAVHGLLHLLGYDHETAAEKALMREREEAVLRTLDLGD